MATLYVRFTDGNDGDNGSTWALAKATLAGAFAAAVAGDTIWVSDNHAETQASAMTLASPGTAASPVRVLCGDDAAQPPTALATTATITTTGTNNIAITSGYTYYYGISFNAGTGAGAGNIIIGSTSTFGNWFESCALKLNGTNTASAITFGTQANSTDDLFHDLYNTTVSFGSVGQSIIVFGNVRWRATSSVVAGSVPTTLFEGSAGNAGRVDCIGLDFSAVGSGKNLIDGALANWNRYTFVDCKLDSAVTRVTGTIPGQGGIEALFVNCAGADTNYDFYRQIYQATETHETTIVKSGGASDGTTSFSRKIVTTANAKVFSPYQSLPIAVWNETTGSAITLTVEVVTDNVTLTDAEAWLEVEYLGTSGFPLGLFARDRVADQFLGTPANQTTSSVTWTTTGLGTPVKQALAVTVTPQEKGLIRCRVCVAKASTTVYYDPYVTVS